MSADPATAWTVQLARPGEEFLAAFAARAQGPEGPRDATREAVKHLAPAVDWAGHLPHLPSGLLGTWAAWRLRPLLAEASFLRLLATQLHAFAREPRKGRGGLGSIARGTGDWAKVEAAVAGHRPALAWGELLGLEAPSRPDFLRVLDLGAADMACLGQKGTAAWFLADLWERLDRPRATGLRLLALSGWLAAAEPADLFWSQRAAVRFPEPGPAVDLGPATDPASHAGAAREVCDLGLVALLDAFCGRVRAGASSGDLLSVLVLALSEKLLDARRDLEGKTSGVLRHLAALAGGLAPSARPGPYAQAAALVNLFPSEEPEERVAPRPPATPPVDAAAALLDAILDAEPREALALADLLLVERGPEAVLRVLAEAASRNDPGFSHAAHALAVACAADLLPAVTDPAGAALLGALAKSLANSQGSGDLGRRADRALAAAGDAP